MSEVKSIDFGRSGALEKASFRFEQLSPYVDVVLFIIDTPGEKSPLWKSASWREFARKNNILLATAEFTPIKDTSRPPYTSAAKLLPEALKKYGWLSHRPILLYGIRGGGAYVDAMVCENPDAALIGSPKTDPD